MARKNKRQVNEQAPLSHEGKSELEKATGEAPLSREGR
jgi:hypothetical protein